MLCLALSLCALSLLPVDDGRDADLAAARALFEQNITAIQQRDREAYLACYLASDLLARGGPQGIDTGFAELEAGTAPSGSDDWPVRLTARDLQLHWLADGLVYGTYRYHVDYGGELVEGLSERVFRRTVAGWRIVVTTAFSSTPGLPAAPLALVGARIHTGAGGPPIADGVVIIRDGLIETIGPRATTVIPEGIDVIDLGGQIITPGLVDAHVHYSQTGWADGRPDAWDLREQYPYATVATELERAPERLHRAFLASGVTAVFDVGGFPWTRRLRTQTETSFEAPHVAAAGPLLTTWVPDILSLPDRQQFVLMESEAQVRAAVRSHAASGSDAIKVWFIARDAAAIERATPLVLVAGDEAAKIGLPLIVHATELATARVALNAGAQLLVHSVEDAPIDQAFIDLAVQVGVSYCPTLTVHQGYIDLYKRELTDDLMAQLDVIHPEIAERVSRTTELPAGDALPAAVIAAIVEKRQRTVALMADNLTRLAAAGVNIAAGTDAGNPLTLHGPSIFPELEAMEAAGMAPLDVLSAATLGAATAMGRGDDLGLLEAGRIADLLVLIEDPAQGIAALRSVTQVMRAGHLQHVENLRPR